MLSGTGRFAPARRGTYATGRVSLGVLIALSLALGVAAWLFFMWTVRSGQYDDPEGAKYRMLEDDDGERRPAPPRAPEASKGAESGASGDAHRGPERSP